jgi:hypothetical protein
MTDESQTTAEPWIWRGTVTLCWRPDCFGKPGRALFVGGLNVGSIMYHKRDERDDPWRAWLMTDEDGNEIGWYLTEREAKYALVDAAVKELCK